MSRLTSVMGQRVSLLFLTENMKKSGVKSNINQQTLSCTAASIIINFTTYQQCSIYRKCRMTTLLGGQLEKVKANRIQPKFIHARIGYKH